MPDMQQAVQQINAALGASGMRDGPPPDADPRADLIAFLDSLRGVQLTPAVKEFLSRWPSALVAAVGAAVADNLSRDESQRVPILFSWTPGYDFSVKIWDVRNTESTHGELTIHLTSRYPSDPHPLDAPPAAALS
jgi:hypothetical protein